MKRIKNGQDEPFADDNNFYRFLDDDDNNALNSGMESLCEPRPAHEVGETLRHLILKLYNSYLSADGKVSTEHFIFRKPFTLSQD